MKFSIETVVNNNLCVGCGICISESKSSKMEINKDGFLVPKLDNSFSESAINLCPFNPAPEPEVKDEDVLANLFLKDAVNFDKRIGKYSGIYVGYSPNFQENSSSGGIATHIFSELLKRKIVNHLFIVKEVNGSYAYQWFNDCKEIQEISKTRYIPVTLEKLFLEIDAKDGFVAVSGVACFVKAIRLKQYYNPKYKQKIKFVVGIICGGLKSTFFTDYLAQKSGIYDSYRNQDYRIKDFNSNALDYSFGAYNSKNVFKSVKMNSIGDMWGTGLFKANACDFCDDVTTELADISLGDAWIDPYQSDGRGTSIVICRSKNSSSLVESLRISDELLLNNLDIKLLKVSQGGSFRHRQMALKFRLDLLKLNKGFTLTKRDRLLESIPFEFCFVQIVRIILRSRSIILWKKSKNIQYFEVKIKKFKSILWWVTQFSYKIQKKRRSFNMRTLNELD